MSKPKMKSSITGPIRAGRRRRWHVFSDGEGNLILSRDTKTTYLMDADQFEALIAPHL